MWLMMEDGRLRFLKSFIEIMNSAGGMPASGTKFSPLTSPKVPWHAAHVCARESALGSDEEASPPRALPDAAQKKDAPAAAMICLMFMLSPYPLITIQPMMK